MLTVKILDRAEDGLFQFAVIASRYRGKWVFCRHKKRDTWELPGGHREPGEAVRDTAARELYEETGALEYKIVPVCPYSVQSGEGEGTFGMLFFAEISVLGELPAGFEMERILLLDGPPPSWTYPEIQPKILAAAKERFGIP